MVLQAGRPILRFHGFSVTRPEDSSRAIFRGAAFIRWRSSSGLGTWSTATAGIVPCSAREHGEAATNFLGDRMRKKTDNLVRLAGRQRDPRIDDAVLNAALTLFLEQGAQGVNFEQIAKRTSISRATIYRRWRTRGDLLNATLRSARVVQEEDPSDILNLSPKQFLRFLEDTITVALTSTVVARLITQLIGTRASHPELLARYCRDTLEPGWQAIFKAIENVRNESKIKPRLDPDLVRDVLAGAIIHRLVSRTEPPKEAVERKWIKRLMTQIGLMKAIRRETPRRKRRWLPGLRQP
jgi:AcrR family transcriptional regulator